MNNKMTRLRTGLVPLRAAGLVFWRVCVCLPARLVGWVLGALGWLLINAFPVALTLCVVVPGVVWYGWPSGALGILLPVTVITCGFGVALVDLNVPLPSSYIVREYQRALADAQGPPPGAGSVSIVEEDNL